MNERSIIPDLAGAVVLIGLVTGLVLEHQTRQQLREEQQALQQQLDRVTELLAAYERQASLPVAASPPPSLVSPVIDPSTELVRLRTELSALRQLTNEWERARNENTQAHAALDGYVASEATPKPVATADFWPRDSWSFAGFGTPDEALRSSLWASYNGDLKALLDSTTGEFQQEMQKKFEAESADKASIELMDEVGNFKSVQVLNRDLQSEDTAVLTTSLDVGDGTQTMKLVLKKVGNDWKVAGMSPGGNAP